MLRNLLGDQLETVSTTVNNVGKWISIAVLSICGLLVTLYAVYVGFKFFKAEDDKARQDAKQQLIYSVVGVVAIAVVYALLLGVVNTLIITDPQPDNNGAVLIDVSSVYTSTAKLVNAILNLIVNVAVVFAVYVGWKLMSAEDDAKRKNAKMQLIYVIVGALAVVFINVIATTVLASAKTTVNK